MKLGFNFGTRDIEFSVEFSDRKTIEVSVEAPDIISVIAPSNTPEDVIIEKVKSRATWIVQKMFFYKGMEYQKINREFVSGESFMYLGRNYSLQLIEDESLKSPSIKLLNGKLIAITPTKDEQVIRQAMEQWYRIKTKERVIDRIKYLQCCFDIEPSGIKVKEQKKRWASCTLKNELLFNWRCIMAKSNVFDYIIVHEMCHIYYKNHSKEFWEMVAAILPDYKERKEWLKNFGVRMDL